MIKKILTYYTARLDEYLNHLYHHPEGLAEVGFISNSTDERPGKIVVSLLNVERETAGGISASVQQTTDGRYTRMAPPLLLNLNIMLAAIFDERRYAESLSILSDTLKFIQSMPNFKVEDISYTIEIVTLSSQELNNVWTLIGGQYYPSVVCKIRRLVIDSTEIVSVGNIVTNPVVRI